jgi:hypothetical protein
LGNAQIVFDKFQVVQAVDAVRLREARTDAPAQKALAPPGDGAGYLPHC